MNYSFYYATRPAIHYINVMLLLLLFSVVMSILMNIDYDDDEATKTNLIFLIRHPYHLTTEINYKFKQNVLFFS